ncbi:MAG: MBL fold metallo-hydrolase [Ardenticatenaceae bacterium]|nr:MBL fold metallo-hydrolase [Ardenticatenaceae bacterium]
MNLYTLDLNFQNVPQTIASYLIVGPDGPVLVETGPGSTLTNLLAELQRHGFKPEDVRHVLVTHIHLDHAGAAGWWAQHGAQVYVHHVGAPHLINPDRLLQSATRIYGDKMDTLWGDFLPSPAERVTAVYDGDVIDVAGLQFTAIESPGHARHHHVYRLGDIAFTGDAAGIHLPDMPMIDVPAPPPEFELEVWEATVDRLLAENFTTLYPTHFGAVNNPAEHLTALKGLMGETAVYIKTQLDAGLERDDLVDAYNHWNRTRARQAGMNDMAIHQYETSNPWYMSVDGISRYWRKREKNAQSGSR